MSNEPSKAYSPAGIESRIYQEWLDGAFFHATATTDDVRPGYSIAIPPPNVTGALHLGHAINNTLQDMLIRRRRMQGHATLWMPGVDHAGIATQAVVEKRLFEDEKKTRHDLGRDALVKRIWAWKEQFGSRIVSQLRLMGCSCDWQRERFTLDAVCARAVREWFFRMFRDGLIVRGKRLVNWDTHLQTAVADDEVYHERVKGSLWHIRYPILSDAEAQSVTAGQRDVIDSAILRASGETAAVGVDYLVVATTRPETMLADCAVAVHPDDERYAKLIGRNVLLPRADRAIPIVGDGVLVKREFGTGCVKVTPGHDHNDYACYQRHPDIGIRNMMTADGKVTDDCPSPYHGLTMPKARTQLVSDLESAGLMEKVEPYETDIGHSDRSKTQIQPFLSDQWFVHMGDVAGGVKLGDGSATSGLAQSAIDAICDNDAHYDGDGAAAARSACTQVHIMPRRYAKSYTDWLAEKRDWCISRQLWWGHRIPVWTRIEAGSGDSVSYAAVFESLGLTHYVKTPEHGGDSEAQVCIRDEVTAEQAAQIEKAGWKRDPDVLDTWFSSALWPMSTMGWPGADSGGAVDGEPEAELFKKFFPTSVLSTAREIITLWVARMVIAARYCDGRNPFRDVVIHPVIQDGQGRPMKKSLGNGVDPVDIIDLYGADALRYTLAGMTTETQDIRIPVKEATLPDGRKVNSSEKFELGRNFCNKLWQASTGFILPNIEDVNIENRDGRFTSKPVAELPLFDRWILTRLMRCLSEFDAAIDSYQFARATERLREFFWTEFCDWYLEESKLRVRDDDANDVKVVLLQVLDTTLAMLHPIVPFITEQIWHEIGQRIPHHMATITADGTRTFDTLISFAWPTLRENWIDEQCEREVENVIRPIVTALRQARTDINSVRSQAKEQAIRTLPNVVVKADETVCAMIQEHEATIKRLGAVDAMEISPAAKKPSQVRSHVDSRFQLYVPLAGLIDLSIEEKRLRKELDEKQSGLIRAQKQLGSDAFVSRASPETVEQTRERAADYQRQCELIEQHLKDLT